MSDQRRILIVEDDMFIRDIYQMKFTQEGFEVVCAENGAEALKKMQNFSPDMILLDIVMPYMDGIATLKEIKKNNLCVNVPIIMLTNISEKEKVSEAMELGANDYLIKSHFTPSEVVHKVDALLNV